jgi:hypothetical protein
VKDYWEKPRSSEPERSGLRRVIGRKQNRGQNRGVKGRFKKGERPVLMRLEENSGDHVAAAAETIVIALAGILRTRLLRTLSPANCHTGLGKDHSSSILGAAAESQKVLHQTQTSQGND